MPRGSKDGMTSRVVKAMVAFLIYFVVIEILESGSGWNSSALYATIIKVTVPVFIALYALLGEGLDKHLTRG